MDEKRAHEFCAKAWDDSIIAELEAYIRIPALSPHFDANWKENGHLEAAVTHIYDWCAARKIEGLSVEVVRIGERTPVIFMEVPAFNGGSNDRTVLLYGHLDKQPEMEGWDADKGPWKPVRIGEKLYGRGGADDGYAAYASLTAIEAVQEQGVKHDRCVILIEACEESGSYDLPAYLEHLQPRIGSPKLVVCLDSGCGDYDHLWTTTSLRGLVGGTLRVEVMEPTEDGSPSGVHSGDGSGIVPSTFRVLRRLLERVENTETGEILLKEFHAEIPEQRVEQANKAAEILGDQVWQKFPLKKGMAPVATAGEAVLNRTWRPFLEVVGTDSPSLKGGNVVKGSNAWKLSIRCPPTVDAEAASAALTTALEANPPYGASVTFEAEQAASGWNAPALAPWLGETLELASQAHFGTPAAYMGEGGTIPFMGMLGEMYPEAQFAITGVLGPASNAHGPNEFLHLTCGKRVTACMASVLATFATLPSV